MFFKSRGTHEAFNAFILHSISTTASPPFKTLPIKVLRLILSVLSQISYRLSFDFFIKSFSGELSIEATYVSLDKACVLTMHDLPNKVNFLLFQNSKSFSTS